MCRQNVRYCLTLHKFNQLGEPIPFADTRKGMISGVSERAMIGACRSRRIQLHFLAPSQRVTNLQADLCSARPHENIEHALTDSLETGRLPLKPGTRHTRPLPVPLTPFRMVVVDFELQK